MLAPHGLAASKDLRPVAPALHYAMGGISTDLDGRTTRTGLWAAGEVSSTGVHGANRLASNSLLEGLVFAERVARDMIKVERLARLPRQTAWKAPALRDRGAAQVAADDVRRVMWEKAGIDRSARGLKKCLETLDAIESRLPVGATEEANLIATGRLIAGAALLRRESRGGHFRSDFPRPKQKWRGKHIIW